MYIYMHSHECVIQFTISFFHNYKEKDKHGRNLREFGIDRRPVPVPK